MKARQARKIARRIKERGFGNHGYNGRTLLRVLRWQLTGRQRRLTRKRVARLTETLRRLNERAKQLGPLAGTPSR